MKLNEADTCLTEGDEKIKWKKFIFLNYYKNILC